MSKELTERNEIILQLHEEGQSYREIAHRFMITPNRVRDICIKQIRIRNGLKERREAERAERKAMREARKKEAAEGVKDCVIRNGAYEMYLTEIIDGPVPVYRYQSADIKDALRFTMENARRIARECHGRAIWL